LVCPSWRYQRARFRMASLVRMFFVSTRHAGRARA
jgi:hypothetical protein